MVRLCGKRTRHGSITRRPNGSTRTTTNEGKKMSRGNIRTDKGREAEIREILRRIVTCAADVASSSDAEPPDLRMRHELAQDLLADACALAYATAQARIERLEPDDVYLRHEAIEDAASGFGEVVRQVTRGLERLKLRPLPASPPLVAVAPITALAHAEARLDRVDRLAACTAAVA
jgi:hypothetical protein